MNIISDYDVIVVGSGAAGYNAACRIAREGTRSVAIVTEAVMGGTSRNTGSDKQTYYKLGLNGDGCDSTQIMAQNLFSGGCVDGDNALCEAALSVRCFMNLCELGVPFPVNRFGEYIGYKTDHDPYARATSAGPLTSKFMVEALEKQAKQLNIPVYDAMYAVQILKDSQEVCGLLCLDLANGGFCGFHASDVVLATGGPAGIYLDSVYPQGHFGATSLALKAGAHVQNLTEWQYGLASVEPRWNVSGTYMQVLPRFVSVDSQGNTREFLLDHFRDPYEALSRVFLKGYQWPFDSAKIMNGSSVIDLLVYRESVILGRKVFLDFRCNPFGLERIEFQKLSAEAFAYLNSAGACFGTPLERLGKMNQPAVELYKSKGVDLGHEMLPIALCAQHNNGGISVDKWWQTAITGLYAAGECAGTHGITRPGGSALNAGQVGSLRAAQKISRDKRQKVSTERFGRIINDYAKSHIQFCEKIMGNESNIEKCTEAAQGRMSAFGGPIRRQDEMERALIQVKEDLLDLHNRVKINSVHQLQSAYRLWDILICQQAVLEAMLDYARTVGTTRGSALYTDPKGVKPEGLDELFRFIPGENVYAHKIQEGVLTEQGISFQWRDVRPIPEREEAFETVWHRFRENGNVY